MENWETVDARGTGVRRFSILDSRIPSRMAFVIR